MEETICEVPRCPETVLARKMCSTHYQRWYKYGDPLSLVRPPATGGIYRIAGPEGRVYIGSASNVRRRWNSHRRLLRLGTHHNHRLQADWNEHGAAAFTFALLEEITDDAALISAEQRYLDAALGVGFTYNLSADCRSPARGLVHTDEARAKMSEAIRAAMTPEHLEGKSRRVQGALNPGSKLTEETVRTICNRLLAGEHPARLAAEMEVSESTVYQIRRGQIWGHIVTPEMVAAMKAVRQNPWGSGKRAVTPEMRERLAGVGRSNRGRVQTAAERARVSKQSRGEGNPKAKLTEAKVRDIKRRLAGGARNKDLAAEYEVHPNSIAKIKAGEVWAHITI